MNELLIILSIILIFSSTIIFFKLFGLNGLSCITVFVTITANIEVMILIKAFGMEQTLGNVLFAASFLCTDIASEIYGKKAADKIVNIAIATSVLFMILTQTWLHYIPSINDISATNIHAIFSTTPRLIISSLLVYSICQKFDVWIYHKIWNYTKFKSKSEKKFLWLRNNISTMTSQLLNSLLFTFLAFYKIYPISSIINIFLSSYVIFLILAAIDTIFIYVARNIDNKIKLANIK